MVLFTNKTHSSTKAPLGRLAATVLVRSLVYNTAFQCVFLLANAIDCNGVAKRLRCRNSREKRAETLVPSKILGW